MFLSYKSQLKGFSKNYFDPFQRKDRIEFFILDTKITTTIGQLNFFKWAIQNKVIDYAKENLQSIHKDMSESQDKSKKIGKRKLLTDNRTYTRTNLNLLMEF